MTDPTPFDAKEFAADVLALSALLSDANEAQWQAGRTPVPREDTTERSKGLTSDPTPNIVADGRRLALRAEVIAAEQALLAARDQVKAAGRHLTDALGRWHG